MLARNGLDVFLQCDVYRKLIGQRIILFLVLYSIRAGLSLCFSLTFCLFSLSPFLSLSLSLSLSLFPPPFSTPPHLSLSDSLSLFFSYFDSPTLSLSFLSPSLSFLSLLHSHSFSLSIKASGRKLLHVLMHLKK